MGQTLQKRTFKRVFLFTALLFGIAFQGVYGQNELSPGDVAIVTANADENEDGDKTFDFVPLVDLEANTEIKFTDAPYIEANSDLEDSEGTITFTTSTAVSAGTIVTYSGEDDGTNGFNRDGSFNPAASGDNIIVYQVENTDTTYLFGIGWARGDSWNHNGGSNSSDIPPNLSVEDNTIVDLGTTDNYQYDAGNGLEGTSNSLLSLIGDESNWNEDDNAFSAFATDFNLINPPTVAFTASSISGEEGSAVEITVELVEENNTAVDVDVEYLENASTASSSDIDDFSTETVSFTDSDASGTEKTVNITLSDDSEFEDSEKAVFQLKNNTEGTIIEPDELTLSITDDDAPDIVFNEINADPGDDANGDGEVDSDTDEFIEWVNNSSRDIDISGWIYADNNSDRFTFPEGTVIPAGNAVVLFDYGTADDQTQPEGSFGGAYIFTDNELGLNNSSEQLKLLDEEGNTVVTTTYENNASGESNVLDPEITGNSYVDHSSVSDGSLSSPGTKVDGSSFGSKHAIAFRGSEGWRMIASPVQNATFNDFFGDLWMQGLTNSNDEGGDVTIFSWSESARSFEVPGDGSMDDSIEPGKGYIVYVFEDDEFNTPGIQGGFPKVIDTDQDENPGTVSINISATDEDNNNEIDGEEGWNLLGNPFGTDISVTALINTLEDNQDIVVQGDEIQVWDHSSGNYIALGDGDRLAPFQAFFVKISEEANTSVDIKRDDLEANTGTEFYKELSDQEKFRFDLSLHEEQYHDTYSLEFSGDGSTELDSKDAYKLFSLNPNSISLFSSLNEIYLRKNALPSDLDSNLEIPLSFDANGRSSLTFRWDENMENIPNEWDLILIDNDQNREIDLRRNNEYSFTVNTDEQEESQSISDEKGVLNKSKVTQDSRFIISVQPNAQGEISSSIPESVKLKPNYPNPFNPTTTIPFELDEDSDVLLTVWNMIGQKVATLIDGTVEAGTHEEIWNASDMPSGMYIARFEVNGTVFTRKMTLIK